MTTRSTRRTVPLAIAGTALVFAWLVDASPRAIAAPAAVAASAAASAQAATPAVAPGTTQYAVKPGQSLADIAAAATQSHDKAVLSRAAKVIFDANPSAFSRGDPSLLKLGAVLNVPPLDATGALAKSAPEPAAAPAAASTPSAASMPAAASQAAAAGAKASGVQTATSASAPAAAVSQASAGAAASAPAKPAAPPATHPQQSAPAAVAGGHAWSGAIEPAPSAASSAPAEAAASATPESSAAGAASGAVASQPAASGGAAAGASAVTTASAAGRAGASAAAAPAVVASRPKVSSLQQLLTLKNRVLMELQRHGFGTSSSSRSGAAGNAPVGASGFAAAPPASAVVAPAPGPSRAAAAANQRFVSVGGYGVARDDIPAIAAVAAAVAAALLVLLVALGISRRKRRAAVPSVGSTGAAASATPAAAEESESAQPLAKPATATDDPIEAEFLSILARNPTSKRALMGLAGRYAERGNVRGFDEIAQRIYRLSGGRGPNWVHIAELGRQLDPENPLFALQAAASDETGLAETPEGGADEQSTSEASASPEWPRADEPEQGPRAEAPAEHPPEGVTVPELTEVIAQPQPGIEPEPQPQAQSELESEAHPASQPESTPAIETAPEAAAQAPAARSETEHEQELDAESSEAASASRPDATLPPEAVAALGALDFGLPPRAEPGPAAPASSHGIETPEQAATDAAQSEPSPHEPPAAPSAQHEPKANAAHEPEDAPAEPLAPPSVTGLGAAPIGPLKLSFNLDLPGADGSEGAVADAAPLPQFTPEQLAKIARNKLDLAAEYIALGDLGGARTLIHEVIESNDAATREDAHALLATLAPLS